MTRKRYYSNEDCRKMTSDLSDYKSQMKHLYASDGPRKLFIDGYGNFIVEDSEKEICRTQQPFVAIESFTK